MSPTRLILEKSYVIMPVPLLSKDRIDQLPERAREVVEYRKSGLSLTGRILGTASRLLIADGGQEHGHG